jgi:hypothetical protein
MLGAGLGLIDRPATVQLMGLGGLQQRVATPGLTWASARANWLPTTLVLDRSAPRISTPENTWAGVGGAGWGWSGVPSVAPPLPSQPQRSSPPTLTNRPPYPHPTPPCR